MMAGFDGVRGWIHHLAVDGVSWRILLEDLQVAYEQLARGEKVQLAPKTTSFKAWSNKLREYARSDVLADELDYWLDESRSRIGERQHEYRQYVEDRFLA